MGHYAAELSQETKAEEKLRKEYWAVREKLENIVVSRLTVSTLHKMLHLLSEAQTPRRFDDSHWVSDVIEQMQNLLSKTESSS